MNKRYNSIIHGYTKSAPKRVKAKQAKQLARQTSLPLGGRSVRGDERGAEVSLYSQRHGQLSSAADTALPRPPRVFAIAPVIKLERL